MSMLIEALLVVINNKIQELSDNSDTPDTSDTTNNNLSLNDIFGTTPLVKGTYMEYFDGNASPFITTANITKAESLANCMTHHNFNPTRSLRCIWNGTEIYSFVQTPPVYTDRVIEITPPAF